MMATQSEALLYAVRPLVVLRHLGSLIAALAVLTILPLAVALLAAEYDVALRMAVVVLGLGLAGFGLTRLPARGELMRNEGFALAALIFLLAPLAMAWPLAAGHASTLAHVSVMDAIFESISGVTTTGLSCLATVEQLPRSLLFTRAWMQWYGGLGFVILSLALVMQSGQSAKSLAVTEGEPRDLAGGMRPYARKVLVVYLVMTLAVTALTFLLGEEPYTALLYALAAVSTGGFAPHDASLSAMASLAPQIAVMLGCLAGALPLSLYLFRRGDKKARAVHMVQLLALCALAALCSLLVAGSLAAAGNGPGYSLRHGLLLGVSAQSTAGFASLDVASLSPLAKGGLIMSMLIGGSVGSTAGGFKVLRLIIAFKLVQGLVRRANLAPHAVYQPALAGQQLRQGEMQEAMAVITLYAVTLGLSWLAFLAYGLKPLDSLFEIASALGTVGLSAGLSGPDLPALLKGVLCADMLLGRLEVLAWLVAFSPATWIGRRP